MPVQTISALNPNVLDPILIDFVARQIAAGSAGCDGNTQEIVNQFITSLLPTTIWAKISRCGILVSDYLGALVPLKVGVGGNASDISTFVAGDYSQATGLQGATTGKYLRTGLTPANAGITVNDGHLIAYMNTPASNNGANMLIGVQSDASARFSQLYADVGAGTLGGRIGTNGGNSTTAIPNRLGLLSINAISSLMNIGYNSQPLLLNPIATSGALASLEYYVMARNDNGSGQSLYNNGRLCFYSIGAGLTPQELSTYYNAIQLLQRQLGRAYTLNNPIKCYGDSFTAGSGGTPYPTDLKTAYPNLLVFNSGVGGDTSTQILARFNADPALRAEAVCVIWSGRNDVIATPATVLANIASMVSTLTQAGNHRYIIATIQNGTGEPSGSSAYNTIMATNATIMSTYGPRAYDGRTLLVNLYNQNDATDVANFAADVPPSTLRSDVLHLNTAGYQAWANGLIVLSGALGYWP